MKRKWYIFSLVMVLMFSVLGACSNNMTSEHKQSTDKKMEMNHSSMNMSGDGKVPESLKEADNPKYKVGEQVIIHADHMEGMNEAEGKVRGAFDTTVYSVSYTPTNGGKPVQNHKWVTESKLSAE